MREDNGTLLNLTIRFGGKVLLDMYDEIVLPAFVDSEPRIYGKTSYLFHKCREEMVNLKTQSAKPTTKKMIVGKFVKDTIYRSTQVFENDELRPTNQIMKTAPSATFGLMLDGHRLIYISDTPSAPGYGAFATTLKKKLTLEWEDYIDRTHEKNMALYLEAGGKDSGRKRPTKKSIKVEVGKPTVELIPFPQSGNLRAKLQRLDTITSIKIRVFPTNQQAQARRMLQEIESEGEALNAPPLLTFNNKTGLEKNAAVELTEAVSNKANADYSVVGEKDGEQSKITPDDVKMQVKHLSRQNTILGDVRSFFETLLRRNLMEVPEADD